jgi:hypothetical protein
MSNPRGDKHRELVDEGEYLASNLDDLAECPTGRLRVIYKAVSLIKTNLVSRILADELQRRELDTPAPARDAQRGQ